jgi:mRNA interferase HicA
MNAPGVRISVSNQAKILKLWQKESLKVIIYLPLSHCVLMKSSELVGLLQKDGWYVIDQKGSHRKMAHPWRGNILIVPFHGSRELEKGLERKILKEAGLL